jgi:RNA polymerase sigma-70 factor, ECF subfamily
VRQPSAYRAAEDTARHAYGRLLAFLARDSRDIAAAEDALADAFAAALECWPRDGVPQRPEAWLLAAARRKLVDAVRRAEVRERHATALAHAVEAAQERAWSEEPFPDERLGMLFACAHPAIDADVRAPLMLRVVLGVDAARIASAFLISPAAMRQRLVRAKTKIRAAGIAFTVPESREARERLATVLDAMYAAFGVSWEESGINGAALDLTQEAIFLARMVATLMPKEPEAYGLLALMLFVESRRNARRDLHGAYVPLDEQDTQLWSHDIIDDAERTLRRAGTHAIGRFQLEAAIQSAHAARARDGVTDWSAIASLYDALVVHTGALGAAVGRAAAHARAYGKEAGLSALACIDATRVATYQPYWAVRAHLTGSAADYDQAIGLAESTAARTFLIAARDAASAPSVETGGSRASIG